MNKIIFLLQKESDYSKFQDEIKKYSSPKIFSLDYESHMYLANNHITHEIADNSLLEKDLKQIDDFTLHFIQNWIPQKLQKEFSVNDIFLPDLIELGFSSNSATREKRRSPNSACSPKSSLPS